MVAVPVTLNVYDLSQGMARQMSPMLLGKQLDGIWHTGVVVFATEYYFGGGICSDPPARTPYGTPLRTVELGATHKSKPEFLAFLASISGRFSMQGYHVLDNNCNNFSDACARFLLGGDVGIPSYIIDLPQEAMDTPLGAMLRPMLENMQGAIRDQSLGHEVRLNGAVAAQASRGIASGSAGLSSGPASLTLSAPSGPPRQAHGKVASAVREPMLLTRANRAGVVSKLREFHPTYSGRADGMELRVQDLLDAQRSLPLGMVFPALDLLRLAATQDAAACAQVAEAAPGLLAKYTLAGPDVPRPDRMMALRVAVNCFAFEEGAAIVMQPGSVESLVEAVAESINHEQPAVSKTAAVLAFNLAGSKKRHPKSVSNLSEESKVRFLFAAAERARDSVVPTSPEEAYPLLSAIAIAVDGDLDSCELVKTLDIDFSSYLDPTICTDDKTAHVAKHLKETLETCGAHQ
jgi:PPPDE putative peptidase domain/PUL domain